MIRGRWGGPRAKFFVSDVTFGRVMGFVAASHWLGPVMVLWKWK